MTRDVTPIPKAPVRPVKSRKPVKRQRAGSAPALKRKATKLWGEWIHERDRVCQVCGRADGKLDAHHIAPKTFMATRADPGNGVLLCSFHHTLGRESVHQDPMFAIHLYVRLLGNEGYTALREKAAAGVNAKYPADFWSERIDELERLLAGVHQ